jgi:putative pyoverdin transport system ATP-binding/permease protein
MRHSRGPVIFAIAAGIVSGLANAALIALIHRAINQGQSPTPSLVWSFVALCILLPVSRFAAQGLLTYLSQKAIFDLRTHLSQRILAAPLRHLEGIGAARLLATLTDDVIVISNALVNIPLFFMHTAILVGCLVYLGWLSWMVFLAVLGFLVVGVMSFRFAAGIAGRYLKRAREAQDAMLGHFRALTEGTKELKLHGRRRQSFMKHLFEETATAYRRFNIIGNTTYAGAASWAQFLFFALFGLLLFGLPHVIVTDNFTLNGYALTLLYMVIPLDVATSMFSTLGRASVALNKVEALGLSLEKDAISDGNVAGTDIARSWESIELAGVTHTYHRERENSSFTLGPIDMTLEQGEIVFLIGGNGSGKTTLAKLLTGLYTPESGEIRLNGQLVTPENVEQYRQNFSAVFSDFYLFERFLGLQHAEIDEHVRRYLTQLQLDNKVQVKDGMLSTIDLSQGQRKRLALLTAYLEDRPIYLFDEWAADQDPLFKDIFYLQLVPELKARGKTVLIISHDDRYYHVGDRIIKLDYGKLLSDLPISYGLVNGELRASALGIS